MKILVFDTETTGLPPRNAWFNEHRLPEWPYIIQLSFTLYDTDECEITYKYNQVIRLSSDIEISERSIEVHGITREMSNKGKEIIDGLKQFKVCLAAADEVIAHNLSFDINMIKAECLRNNFNIKLLDVNERMLLGDDLDKEYYCTMRETKNYCNIRAIGADGEPYIKFPSLKELYTKIFNRDPIVNLHDAYIDSLICLKCYLSLKHNDDTLDISSNLS